MKLERIYDMEVRSTAARKASSWQTALRGLQRGSYLRRPQPLQGTNMHTTNV